MPALEPTDIVGTITWLGFVPHRDEENRIDGAPLPK